MNQSLSVMTALVILILMDVWTMDNFEIQQQDILREDLKEYRLKI